MDITVYRVKCLQSGLCDGEIVWWVWRRVEESCDDGFHLSWSCWQDRLKICMLSNFNVYPTS